jgi:hypothetical protein
MPLYFLSAALRWALENFSASWPCSLEPQKGGRPLSYGECVKGGGSGGSHAVPTPA